jgi:hypothetical protein
MKLTFLFRTKKYGKWEQDSIDIDDELTKQSDYSTLEEIKKHIKDNHISEDNHNPRIEIGQITKR